MKKSILFLFVLTAFVLLQSCEEGLTPGNDNPDNLVAPALPAVEMLVMPTTEVEEMESNATEGHSRDETYNNWLHAGLSLLGWNTVVLINMAIPVGAIGQAFNQDARYIGDNTFEWAYTYTAPSNIGGGTYDVSLTAEYINTTEIEWKLTATQAGVFTDFVWLSAIIANDHSSAEFILNRRPASPQPYIGLSYKKEVPTNLESLRFTNIIPGGADQGDYIEYRVAPGAVFNRAFDVKLSDSDILYIEWDEPTNVGRVKHKEYFGDDAWYCWDEKLLDVDC